MKQHFWPLGNLYYHSLLAGVAQRTHTCSINIGFWLEECISRVAQQSAKIRRFIVWQFLPENYVMNLPIRFRNVRETSSCLFIFFVIIIIEIRKELSPSSHCLVFIDVEKQQQLSQPVKRISFVLWEVRLVVSSNQFRSKILRNIVGWNMKLVFI